MGCILNPNPEAILVRSFVEIGIIAGIDLSIFSFSLDSRISSSNDFD